MSEPTNEPKKSPMKWYVVNTFSGQEMRAKTYLEDRIQQYKLAEFFEEIMVPTETVAKMEGGVRKESIRKVFPGYMLVQMILNDETAHLVRNTQKVTGFVGGSGKTPPPSLTAREVDRLKNEKIETKIAIEFEIGDKVRVIDGPFANFNGDVEEVKSEKQKLKVNVAIFGRSTPVELEYAQVEKVA